MAGYKSESQTCPKLELNSKKYISQRWVYSKRTVFETTLLESIDTRQREWWMSYGLEMAQPQPLLRDFW
jgi:hypothetical protein